MIVHAAGEMLTRGQDAHPNQIYLMTRLRKALERGENITLDWAAMRLALPKLDAASQTRVLDLLTVSCVIGTSIQSEQTALLRSACQDCGASLNEDRLKDLRKELKRGHQVTATDLSATRCNASSSAA